jgi:hypothetical protein
MALVDPNIAMSYRGIELPNQLAQYGQLAQIQNAQNQNQLAQYQLGAAQRADIAQNALNKAYQDSIDPVTGQVDFAAINRSLAAAGAGSQIPGQLKAQSELDTAKLTRDKARTELIDARVKQARSFLDTVNPADPNAPAQLAAWNTANHQDEILGPALRVRGILPDQFNANLNAAVSNGPQALSDFINRTKLGAEKFAELNKPTLTPQNLGNTVRILSSPGMGGAASVVPGSTANVAMAPGEAARLAISAAGVDPYGLTGLAARFGGGPTAVPAPTGAVKPNIPAAIQAGLTGEDFLTHLPTSLANQIRAIGEGREPSPAARSLTSPAGRQLMELVTQAYPNYDAKEYATKTAAEKSFIGKRGDTVRSFNVLVDHLGTLQQTADALQNGDTRAFNQAANFIGLQTGNPAPADFTAVKRIVADEINKAVIGGAGALGDRKAIDDAINSASSPQQLSSVITKYKQLAGGQLNGLEQQYSATTGKKDFKDKFLSPAARSTFGAVTTGVSVTDPNGGVHTFPNEQAAAAFRKAIEGSK